MPRNATKSSYNRLYFQGGAIVTQATLMTGYEKMYCSMAASAFPSANIPFDVNPEKVKERDFFGTKMLEILGIGSNVGGIFSAECSKTPPKPEKEWLAERANPITLEDLKVILGSLITIAVEAK